MKNRNLLLFIVLSVALLGGYSFMMSKLYPPKPAPEQAAVITPANPATQPAAAPAAAPAAVPASTTVDPKAIFTLAAGDLDLTWRKQDGALVQAVWKQDGTRFFPWEHAKDGRTISLDFPGIGGSTAALFEGDPQVVREGSSQRVVFQNAAGERLSYMVPDKGHILEVAFTSPLGNHLYLIRSQQNLSQVPDGKGGTYEVNPYYNLGKVFTLDDKDIERADWIGMLKDPFFKFLGFKRAKLPPASARLGLDAGIDKINEAARNQYFAAIWESSVVPERDTERHLGYHAAGANGVSARLYLGPKQQEELAAFGKSYTQVVDYGFFGLVAKFLFWIIRAIHGFIPNWGWTIVVFSVILRLAMWSLNTKTTVQMLRMKDLEPHQKALQAKYEKFGNDMAKKAEMQKELMAFYKKNGHNPMGGCLPMLLQMPIFIALWSSLSAVYELRHAPFIGWIKDLSQPEIIFRLPLLDLPVGVLPVLLGASMIAQQALTPATGDPAQRKMMMFMMPAMMVFFFMNTPAGLCLYYLMFNLIGMGQAWWIKRNYVPQPVVI